MTIISTNFEISTAVLLANDPETYFFPKIIAINFNLTLKELSFLFLIFIIFLFVFFGGRGSRTIHFTPPLTLLYPKTEGEEPVLHASQWNNHDVKLQMDVNWEKTYIFTAWREVALTAERSDNFRIKDQIKVLAQE